MDFTSPSHYNELLAGPPQIGGDPFELEVRRIMTPGVVSIVEHASLRHVFRAMMAHRVHALLVVGGTNGEPIGWVTDRGLLDWFDRDETLHSARDAVTEEPVAIDPNATASEARIALSQPGRSRLLVRRSSDTLPEGVVVAMDLVALRQS